MLITADPNTVVAQTKGGMTPLYEAASSKISRILSPYLRFVDRYELKMAKPWIPSQT